MQAPEHPRWLALSAAVFARLLFLYPAAYRRRYGGDMLATFQDYCHSTIQERGLRGLVTEWAFTLLDIPKTAIREHLKQAKRMPAAIFVRLAGLAGILAGISWAITPLFDPSLETRPEWLSVGLLAASLATLAGIYLLQKEVAGVIGTVGLALLAVYLILMFLDVPAIFTFLAFSTGMTLMIAPFLEAGDALPVPVCLWIASPFIALPGIFLGFNLLFGLGVVTMGLGYVWFGITMLRTAMPAMEGNNAAE